MSEILLKTDIIRDNTFLYFCGTSKEGKILVCRAKMARRGKSATTKKK